MRKEPKFVDKEKGFGWLVEKIRRRETIEEKADEPLFESIDDKVPLFVEAALLDSLHDIWRLNSEKLVYRLGVIMGHKLRVELGEKLRLEEVGGWEGCVEQVSKMLEFFSSAVHVRNVTRLYARFEREGCPCKRMSFSIGYCPQDTLISGIMAGFAQRAMNDDAIYCRNVACGKASQEGFCTHELKIREEG